MKRLAWTLIALGLAAGCGSAASPDGSVASSTGGAGGSTSEGVGASAGATVGEGGAAQSGASTAGGAEPSHPAGGAPAAPPDYCSICALTTTSTVAQGAIDEASGLAASHAHPGAYYVNNDSGDLPRFFAVGSDGADLGVVSMPVTNVDYEDIAVAPCPAGSCVFVADIGDNDAVRASVALYRLPEPAALGMMSATPDTLPFVYPDGPHNAETLLVHPLTGEIVIVTKHKSGSSSFYRAPDGWAPGQLVTLERAGTITPPEGSPRFTSGSVHPAGHGVLLRTYTHVFFYAAATPDEPLATTLGRAPCALPVADEAKGEGISWTAAGDGYATIGEGVPTYLHQASCHAK